MSKLTFAASARMLVVPKLYGQLQNAPDDDGAQAQGPYPVHDLHTGCSVVRILFKHNVLRNKSIKACELCQSQ